MNLFFVENKYPLRIQEWGDFGVTLWSGFAAKDDTGDIFIERVGPFTPEIYVVMNFLICTEKMKLSLIDSEIKGVNFLPVQKQKIINLDWQNFAPNSEIYDILPDVNEPDELLTSLKNDDKLLSSMPNYGAIKPSSKIKIRQIAPYKYKTRHSAIEAYDVESNLGDIVVADTRSGYFVTDHGREIFEKIGGNFLEFVPLKISS